jgi:hypothetical protein
MSSNMIDILAFTSAAAEGSTRLTVGKGVVDTHAVTTTVVFAGLLVG